MSRCYVYALTDAVVPRLRIGGRSIYSIEAGRLYAAVARIDTMPPATEEALCEQQAVVSRVFSKVNAILPARFGALIDTAELERFARLHESALVTALDLVRGREQMTVRVFGPSGPRGVPARRTGSGTEYLRSRREASHGVPLPAVARRIRRAVRPVIAAERTLSSTGPLRATLWHLVERGTSDAYRKAVAQEAVPPPFRVTVSGPWPPFAFAPELFQ